MTPRTKVGRKILGSPFHSVKLHDQLSQLFFVLNLVWHLQKTKQATSQLRMWLVCVQLP